MGELGVHLRIDRSEGEPVGCRESSAVVPECFVVPENAGSTRAAKICQLGAIRTISRMMAAAGEVRVLEELKMGLELG
jgi:hypothetical protein